MDWGRTKPRGSTNQSRAQINRSHRGQTTSRRLPSWRQGLVAIAIGSSIGLGSIWASPIWTSVSQAIGSVEHLNGVATVIDGDTIDIHGTRIRLHAIDAPEGAQLCNDAQGKQWRCGQQAALALADRISRSPVNCEATDKDQYGRTVAICRKDGEDLNGWMVNEGWAVAYRQYGSDYVSQETAAKAAQKNIWAGKFAMPWDWRRSQQAIQVETSPARLDCTIKGNISSGGERIYHVQTGKFYDATRIDPVKGERWFCSEAAAIAAGWRKSLR